jgi:hypothetical protein
VLAEHVQLYYETDSTYLQRFLFERELKALFFIYLNFHVLFKDVAAKKIVKDFIKSGQDRLQRLNLDSGALYPQGFEHIVRCKYFLQQDLDYFGICLFLFVLSCDLEKAYMASVKYSPSDAVNVNLGVIRDFKKRLGGLHGIS